MTASMKCRVCRDKDTTVKFNIDFKALPVCEVCADNIMVQNIQHNLNVKWKTYREIKKQEAN